jgi:glycosyltransferase involved in cell wall biosynthesis
MNGAERLKTVLLVTDAWAPQTNGVVTMLQNVTKRLSQCGWQAVVMHPTQFSTLPLPGYAEIRVAVNAWRVASRIERIAPDAIHVATEGPLGLAARRWCIRNNHPFSTSLHTKFPEYLEARTGVPASLGYRFLRWFHAPARVVLCTTERHRQELEGHGLRNLSVWGAGVDLGRFRPVRERRGRRRPVLLYAGRIAVEKNLEAFLDLPFDGVKRVVGDGPAKAGLEAQYPQVQWTGYRFGDELVAEYADADVFVFPSRTDTFGLVMLEAMACGTPVAAYPVTGPIDIVRNGENGWLSDDLRTAIVRALEVPRCSCRRSAEHHDWSAVAERFAAALAMDGNSGATNWQLGTAT